MDKPEKLKLPVVERFVSINGEGRNAGKRAAFIRFRGCNLRCSYCDTAWAWSDDSSADWCSLEDLVSWVGETGVEYVTLTGGEPLRQSLLPELIASLVRSSQMAGAPLLVEIETNGSQSVALVTDLRNSLGRPDAVQLTMDWKLPSSGMTDTMLEENLALLETHDVLKLVVGTEEDLAYAVDLLERTCAADRCQVYASPVFGSMEPERLAEAVISRQLPGATLQLQLHKIIWPAVERGV